MSKNSNISISQTKFLANIANRAGVIDLGSDSYMSIDDVMFLNNLAYYQAGVLYIQTGSYMNAILCEFKSN